MQLVELSAEEKDAVWLALSRALDNFPGYDFDGYVNEAPTQPEMSFECRCKQVRRFEPKHHVMSFICHTCRLATLVVFRGQET